MTEVTMDQDQGGTGPPAADEQLLRWHRPLPTAQKANTAAARIGASATDEPAVEPY